MILIMHFWYDADSARGVFFARELQHRAVLEIRGYPFRLFMFPGRNSSFHCHALVEPL